VLVFFTGTAGTRVIAAGFVFHRYRLLFLIAAALCCLCLLLAALFLAGKLKTHVG
jgi:hypothetical protein